MAIDAPMKVKFDMADPHSTPQVHLCIPNYPIIVKGMV